MFWLGDLKTIFQILKSTLKWRDDKKAMKLYEQLLSDQENNPECLYFSPTDSEDRKSMRDWSKKDCWTVLEDL